MKTNYILLFALMLMVSLKSSAQIFSGRVIGENQLPVEYATVALLSVPDSALVGGAVTDSKGVFKITAQDAGPYLLSVSVKGQSIGSFLLNFIKSYFIIENKTGCRFLTVDAYAAAVPFYMKNGFVPLNDEDVDSATRLLYFDLNDIVK